MDVVILVLILIILFRLGKEWPGGKKGHLLVPMTSEVDGWKLEINSSTTLTSLEVSEIFVISSEIKLGFSFKFQLCFINVTFTHL